MAKIVLSSEYTVTKGHSFDFKVLTYCIFLPAKIFCSIFKARLRVVWGKMQISMATPAFRCDLITLNCLDKRLIPTIFPDNKETEHS